MTPGLRLARITTASAGLAASASAEVFTPELRATPTLVTEHTGVTPGGTVRIAVDFAIDKGWHLYWPGRNDTGFEPQVDWTLPTGWSVSDIRWPAPQRYISPGDILDHVYENRVTLIADLAAPATATPGESARISAEVSWLVCKDVCIPEDATVSLAVPVIESPAPSQAAPAFAAAESRWPTPPQPGTVTTDWSGLTLAIAVPAGADRVEFFPHADVPEIVDPIDTLSAAGPALSVPFTRDLGPVRRVAGVLAVTTHDSTRWLMLDVPGPDAPPPGSGRRY